MIHGAGDDDDRPDSAERELVCQLETGDVTVAEFLQRARALERSRPHGWPEQLEPDGS